ncbi:MAG TPA: roadblock/LC7 domain-containing protein [Methanoregulaceae archaeon]|nr:roadblock/LC7 domain-containing protein [Methanoregulaceae archaeon]
MNLPEGTHIGYIANPLKEGDVQQIITLVGTIRISTSHGQGFILIDQGKLIAAMFSTGIKEYKGKHALEIINAGAPETMELRRFDQAEFKKAAEVCRAEGLMLEEDRIRQDIPNLLDENKLKKILKQPGVVAVSAFSEGFAVYSLGKADFDQVAAMAEDLLRAGMKIATDIKMGTIDQIILETGLGKLIIAPYGDLYLCVYTSPDANLGLIRMTIKILQEETRI